MIGAAFDAWMIVPGWVLSFIGLAVSISNGGLW